MGSSIDVLGLDYIDITASVDTVASEAEFELVLTCKDGDGDTDTGYTGCNAYIYVEDADGTALVIRSGGTIIPDSKVAVTSGVATISDFNVVLPLGSDQPSPLQVTVELDDTEDNIKGVTGRDYAPAGRSYPVVQSKILVFTLEPTAATRGDATIRGDVEFALTVQAQDGDGNVLTGATDEVTFSLVGADGAEKIYNNGAELTTDNLIAGELVYTQISLEGGSGFDEDVKIRAAATGYITGDTEEFDIYQPALEYTTEPTAVTRATNFTLALKIVDHNSATIASAAPTTTLTLNNCGTGDSLSDTTIDPGDWSSGTWTDAAMQLTGGSGADEDLTITASATGYLDDVTGEFSVGGGTITSANLYLKLGFAPDTGICYHRAYLADTETWDEDTTTYNYQQPFAYSPSSFYVDWTVAIDDAVDTEYNISNQALLDLLNKAKDLGRATVTLRIESRAISSNAVKGYYTKENGSGEPTLTVNGTPVTPTEDTYVNSCNPSTVYGDRAVMRVCKFNCTRVSFIKFTFP